jgi:hypothetical protein
MASKIFSKITEKGKQSLYLKTNGKEYYLFSQNYRRSVKEYYSTPITVDLALDFSYARGHAVRRTMEKLRSYIPYVEKEYGISVLNKTIKHQHPNKTVRTICDYDYYEVA